MAITILEHNRDSVYLYAGNNRDEHHPELESVTYTDEAGAAHTITVDKELGFTDPRAIVEAVHLAHEAQQQEVRRADLAGELPEDRSLPSGNRVFADKLRELAPASQTHDTHQEGGEY